MAIVLFSTMSRLNADTWRHKDTRILRGPGVFGYIQPVYAGEDTANADVPLLIRCWLPEKTSSIVGTHGAKPAFGLSVAGDDRREKAASQPANHVRKVEEAGRAGRGYDPVVASVRTNPGKGRDDDRITGGSQRKRDKPDSPEKRK